MDNSNSNSLFKTRVSNWTISRIQRVTTYTDGKKGKKRSLIFWTIVKRDARVQKGNQETPNKTNSKSPFLESSGKKRRGMIVRIEWLEGFLLKDHTLYKVTGRKIEGRDFLYVTFLLQTNPRKEDLQKFSKNLSQNTFKIAVIRSKGTLS